MGYVPGLNEDEAEHARYCDLIVNGPAIGMPEHEHVVWVKADDRILLVTDSSSEEQRKLAHDVSTCANREMHYDKSIYRHYDPPDERQVQIFLYVRTSRAVGMCIIERRAMVWSCTWNGNETPICVEQPEKAPMWSVGFIWSHSKHRHTGIAYILLKEAKRVLNLNHDDIGWYPPFSAEGKVFVRRQYPTHFFVAK